MKHIITNPNALEGKIILAGESTPVEGKQLVVEYSYGHPELIFVVKHARGIEPTNEIVFDNITDAIKEYNRI
jgi:hypothetical protein